MFVQSTWLRSYAFSNFMNHALENSMAQADRISLRKFIPTAIFDSNRSSFQYMDVAFAKVCFFKKSEMSVPIRFPY